MKSYRILALAIAAVLLAMCKPVGIDDAHKDLDVRLGKNQFTLPYGVVVDGSFMIGSSDGDVAVAVRGVPDDITFVCDVKAGTFSFRSAVDDDADISAEMVFSDRKSSIAKEIILKTQRKADDAEIKAPSEVSVLAGSGYVYPYPAEFEIQVEYAVDCDDAVDEVTAEGNGLVIRKVSEADDHKSGKLAVKAAESLGNSATLIVKARNDGGAAAGSVTFGRAFLGVDIASAEAPADITKALEIHIDSNVPYYFTQTGLDFAELELTDNTLTVNLTRNTSLQPRGGEITIADQNNVLMKRIPVTQKAAVANNDTDRAALMAIYDALNMKEWTEYGAFGSYYANWGTDAPMDKWLGLNWTDWDGKGRLWQLELMGTQPNSTGYIPEELGNLTALREFAIYPNHKITHLPESIKNLTKLEEIIFLRDDMEHIDISEWTGLAELMNNPDHKLWSICFSYTKLHGTIPEWVANLEDKGQFTINDCHFSGQVPEAIAKSNSWNHKFSFNAYEIECYPRFKDGMFEKIDYGDSYYYSISIGDYNILTQADNYALWVGERPENTKWVEDSLGGHWEWTD